MNIMLILTILYGDAWLMFDPITLDQLRVLIAVDEEGTFSAAGRKLKRAQSAVSTAVANLEDQLGVPIFDRTTKIPSLTDQGRAVLAAARRVFIEVDALRRLTSGMVMGLEASVSLCVDALFPLGSLVDLSRDFAREFPAVDLRVDTQSATAVAARVLDGSATIGVMSLAGLPPGLERQILTPIAMVPVVAASHPFASLKGPIPTARFSDAIQIVLSERADAGAADQCVLSTRVWRVADLRTDHEMVRAGLGWANLPEHIVRDDVQAGRLVAFRPQAWGEAETRVHLSAVFRGDSTFGPARRWVLGRLGHLCVRDAAPATTVQARTPTTSPLARPRARWPRRGPA
jgi:DNA-binding transcriptional LysR family regulator